ncbi:MAG: S8 family serine peptidase [Pseudomonadota bacterium]
MRSICRWGTLIALAFTLSATVALASDDELPPVPTGASTGRLIVKLKPNNLPKNLNARQIQSEQRKPLSTQRMNQLAVVARTPLLYVRSLANGAHIVDLGSAASHEDIALALADIRNLSDIEYVEEDSRAFPTATPSDPMYSSLWSFRPVSADNYGADFQTAWDTVTGRSSMVVAVVDTGILPHPDIVGTSGTVSPATGNLVSPGYDFISDCRERATCAASTADSSSYAAPSPGATDLGDWISSSDANVSTFSGCSTANSSWHGTHIAGTIAALGNNSEGVIGGAFGAKVLPVRVLGKCGGHTSDITEGILWAAGVHPTISNPTPAKVINLSLGGSGACGSTYQSAIDAAVAAGAVVVVAAGNGGTNVSNTKPANCNNVITVSAVGQTGTKAYYSNVSTSLISLAAQGGDSTAGLPILSTSNTGTTTYSSSGWTYRYKQGTSMAVPHVSATAALMFSRNPSLTPAQVKTILTAPTSLTRFPAGSDCATQHNCGAGILNANLATINGFTPLTTSPVTVDFGSQSIDSNTSRTVTLTNNGKGSITTGTVLLAGPGIYSLQSNSCNSRSLAPGNSCTLQVGFSPTQAGITSATLSVPTTALGGNTTTNIGLTAGVSYLTTSSQTVTPPPVLADQSSMVTLTFTNGYTLPVTVGSAHVSDSTLLAVSTNHCSNTTLAAADSCSINVITTPTRAGAFSGTLSLNTTGVGDAPIRVTISGTTIGSAEQSPSSSDGADGGGGGGGGCTINRYAGIDPTLCCLVVMASCYVMRRKREREGSKR